MEGHQTQPLDDGWFKITTRYTVGFIVGGVEAARGTPASDPESTAEYLGRLGGRKAVQLLSAILMARGGANMTIGGSKVLAAGAMELATLGGGSLPSASTALDGAEQIAIGSVQSGIGTLLIVNSSKLPRFDGPKPTHTVNPVRLPGRLRPGKTPQSADAEAVFRNAVPNDPVKPNAWFGRNADGQIYCFSVDNNGTAHFSGIDGVGDGTRNITQYAIDRLNGL